MYNEQEIWQEMQETLHETYEAYAGEINEMTGETVHPRTTHAVVIRIHLVPDRQPVFHSAKQVIGATKGVQAAPVTGRPAVPVKIKELSTGEVGKGIVYMPEIGAQELELSFLGPNALGKAAGWLGKTLTRFPKLAQKIKGVSALTNGKPCPGCEKNFASQLKQMKPPGKTWNFSLKRDADGKIKGQVDYRAPGGKVFSANAGWGGGGPFAGNVQGQNMWGSNFGGNVNANNGNWSADGNYQGPGGAVQANASGDGTTWQGGGNWVGADGQNVNAGASGGPGSFDGNVMGNVGGGDFGAMYNQNQGGAAGGGYYNGPGGQQVGGAFSNNPGGFVAGGGWNLPGSQGNANVNIQKELENTALGEIFQELGM